MQRQVADCTREIAGTSTLIACARNEAGWFLHMLCQDYMSHSSAQADSGLTDAGTGLL